ncbi:MAG: glycoside hydrolase family 104 protein [Thiobacillus sp.]|nr:glycoside hydrolase family 104 protein [Thiobacillus sp.]
MAALGVLVGVVVWLATRRDVVQSIGSGFQSAYDNGVDYMGALGESFGFVKTSNMSAVDKSLVNHPNVRAMLRVIRNGESSQDDVAYQMLCGQRGAAFTSFADHPRPALPSPCSRGAAGAYQIIIRTWDWVRGEMKLPDFSPASQDLAALGLIAYRGALPAVLAGDVATAVAKLKNEWTSLPGGAENNPLAGDVEKARRLFVAWGGSGRVYA